MVRRGFTGRQDRGGQPRHGRESRSSPRPPRRAARSGSALGPDGNMWFTESAAGKIGEINPTTHAITEFPTPTANSGPVAIVAGPDGNMWFTESAVEQDRRRSTRRRTSITEFPVTTPNSRPFGIAAGPDGNIWFTEKTREQDRRRSTRPRTRSTSSRSRRRRASRTRSRPGPTAPSGSPSRHGNRVAVFAPPAPPRSLRPRRRSSGPLVIVPGADGNMWFTEGGTPGAVASINPVTEGDHVVRHADGQFERPSEPHRARTATSGSRENAVAKVGRVGAGRRSRVLIAPAVLGTATAGQTLTCQAASLVGVGRSAADVRVRVRRVPLAPRRQPDRGGARPRR